MPQERRWLKVKEAARYLGSHPRSVRRALAAGKIPYSKVRGIGVRIDRLGLDEILAGRKRAGG